MCPLTKKAVTRPVIHTAVKRLLSTQTSKCKWMIKQPEADGPLQMVQEMEEIKKKKS